MENIFVNVRAKYEPNYSELISKIDNILENNVAICYSNQFEGVAKKLIEKINKNVVQKMQVLGCSNPKFKKEVEAIIIVGQGKFHSVSLAYESKLPTYIVEGSSLKRIADVDIKKMEAKERGSLLKYLSSDKIGILITTKPGQMRMKKAIEFKNKLKKKKSYLFIANNIDTNEFENFRVDSWVNTACPRMDLNEGSIINLDKIPEELIE